MFFFILEILRSVILIGYIFAKIKLLNKFKKPRVLPKFSVLFAKLGAFSVYSNLIDQVFIHSLYAELLTIPMPRMIFQHRKYLNSMSQKFPTSYFYIPIWYTCHQTAKPNKYKGKISTFYQTLKSTAILGTNTLSNIKNVCSSCLFKKLRKHINSITK